jgi:transcriptional regulator with XRE-family HTH domain
MAELMRRLRELRKQRGFSIRGLAKRAGVSLATIQNLEAGTFDPRLSTLRKLAKALGVTLSISLEKGKQRNGG